MSETVGNADPPARKTVFPQTALTNTGKEKLTFLGGMEETMDWKKYFEKIRGTGFLSTANAKGEVNTAVYARPRVLEDGTFVFGMADRLTHANLGQNPRAIYAFHEGDYRGHRIYLEKIREEEEGPILERIRDNAKIVSSSGAADKVKYAVYFRVVNALPLVGT